jgi:hypothetical protein
VAHPGKKIALGVICPVRFFLGFAERFFDSRPVSHVVRHAENDFVLGGPVSRPKDIDHRTIFAHVAIDEVGDLARRAELPPRFLGFRPVLGMDEVVVTLADQFLGGVTPKLFAGGIHAQEAIIVVHGADDVLRIVHDELVGVQRRLQFAAAFVQGGFALFPLRDVLDHEQEMLRLTLVITNDARGPAYPKDLAVLVDVTFVARPAHRPVQQTLGELPARLDVFAEGDVLRGPFAQLFIGIADHFAEGGVDLKEPFIQGQDRHADRRAFEKLAKDRVAQRDFQRSANGRFERRQGFVHAKR